MNLQVKWTLVLLNNYCVMDELLGMIIESEKQIANGETLTDDEVWSKYEKEMTE